MLRSIKNSLNVVAGSFLAFMFFVAFSLPMHAQVGPSDIRVHFSNEVAVPNHLLQPGDYIFRQASSTNPDTYEILANNGQNFVGFFEAVPTERLQSGDSKVTLSAPDAAGVRMVQTWYGPGDTDGYQLFYSKKDVRKLDRLARAQSASSVASGD